MVFSIFLLVAFLYIAYRVAPREREEDAQRLAFGMLTMFGLLTVTMFISLIIAHLRGVPPIPTTGTPHPA